MHALVDQIGHADQSQWKCSQKIVGVYGEQVWASVPHNQDGDASQSDRSQYDGSCAMCSIQSGIHD